MENKCDLDLCIHCVNWLRDLRVVGKMLMLFFSKLANTVLFFSNLLGVWITTAICLGTF